MGLGFRGLGVKGVGLRGLGVYPYRVLSSSFLWLMFRTL